MQPRVLIHLLVLYSIFFESGYCESICKWSNRLIPSDTTGNYNVTVPIFYSYRSGYINDEPFGTYLWARGWCTHNQDYFRCPYGEFNDVDTTVLSLPKIEDILYVMLDDSAPITLHRPEDKTVPGFYVTANDRLEVCTQYTTVSLTWSFNGNETDIEHVSCGIDGYEFCSGARLFGTPKDGKCAYHKAGGRIRIRYNFSKSPDRFGFYYCYLDKTKIKAQTFIVDWINGFKNRLDSTTKELKGSLLAIKDAAATTSSTKMVLGELWPIWLLLILTKQL